MNVLKFSARRRLFGAAVLLSLLAAGCASGPVGVSWPDVSFLGDTQQIVLAFNDRVVMVNPENGDGVELRNAEGTVRVDEQGNPRLWDVRGGETPVQFYASPILLDEDTLLIPGYNKLLFEVDIPTARVENPTGTAVGGYIVADFAVGADALYLGLAERNLVALDRSDLSELWVAETEHGVWAQPLLVENRLYFSSLDHNLYAVNTDTGETLWTLDLQGAATSTPVYQDGHLYIGSFARKIFDINADTGVILNEYATENWVWSSPALVDGMLYTADLGGFVYALDTSDGGLSEVWKVQAATRAIRPTPLVSGDTIVVGSRDHHVYWLNRETGEVTDNRELSSEVMGDMLLIEPSDTLDISEPLVVVSTMAQDQLLVAFTLERGERIWDYGW
ncbi:MAG: PQQ-binding-like beta-propeller repeat protein [Burkholderiales bacterium]|nr:PQQ-binding-like beta-propeller repeat protein [Anaerolineae bacterium]